MGGRGAPGGSVNVGEQTAREEEIANASAVNEPMPDNMAAWFATGNRDLSPDEQAAMSAYLGEGYLSINNSLRSGEDLSPAIESQIAGMDSVIASQNPLAEEAITYKGITEVAGITGLNVGDTFTDPAYFSTSTSIDAAFAHAGPSGTVIEVTSPVGTQGLSNFGVSGIYSSEEEVTLGRGTTFQVTSISSGKMS